MRGEYSGVGDAVAEASGSPPHARGILCDI